ncbi:unnamed protein product [Cuscuta epithymum]|uniref:Malectin domain-containing protein n=1 Tax=Cuscuta epithymum TaxID=186058 RepID=A0AAV0CDD5_9ASTE|nr:unnamed protein product [Cuscuta epithymum]
MELSDLQCTLFLLAASFSIKCGGKQTVSVSGTQFDDDSETLGPASFYMGSNEHWSVSSSGIFIDNPNGPIYTAQTGSQITHTLDSELYKTARISPTSLRYYGLGLKNGTYSIDLHFSEIQMDDSQISWKGLGSRLFDIYIQCRTMTPQMVRKDCWDRAWICSHSVGGFFSFVSPVGKAKNF